MPHPRRSPCRTASAAILARRREHARQRLQKGAELTFDERRRIADLLARLGREAENIEDDLASIQHSIAHYWLMLVRMAEDNSSRLDRIASLAAELGEALAEPYQHWPPVAEADPE